MPPNPLAEILANTQQIIANTQSIIATQAIHTTRLDAIYGLVASSHQFTEEDRAILLELLQEVRDRLDTNYDEALL